MGRKIWLLFIPLVILTMLVSGVCRAKESDEKKIKEQDDKKMKELAQKAKEKLNNTAWQIELNQMETAGADTEKKPAQKKQGPEMDTLYFENNTIKSDKLTAMGFPTTNYTVRVKGENNDVVVWETMQTSADKGIAFWRGELLENGVMRGVLSWHVDEKDKRDYTFASIKKEIAQEATEPVVQEVKEEVRESIETEQPPLEIETKEATKK